jgi:hypothetical protein
MAHHASFVAAQGSMAKQAEASQPQAPEKSTRLRGSHVQSCKPAKRVKGDESCVTVLGGREKGPTPSAPRPVQKAFDHYWDDMDGVRLTLVQT